MESSSSLRPCSGGSSHLGRASSHSCPEQQPAMAGPAQPAAPRASDEVELLRKGHYHRDLIGVLSPARQRERSGSTSCLLCMRMLPHLPNPKSEKSDLISVSFPSPLARLNFVFGLSYVLLALVSLLPQLHATAMSAGVTRDL